jgi:hypothetical protein
MERATDRNCPYLNENGCILNTHKPPVCVSYACDSLVSALRDKGIEYKWSRVHSWLLEVLYDVTDIPLYEGELPGSGISDEEYSDIKKTLEDSLKPKVISSVIV